MSRCERDSKSGMVGGRFDEAGTQRTMSQALLAAFVLRFYRVGIKPRAVSYSNSVLKE